MRRKYFITNITFNRSKKRPCTSVILLDDNCYFHISMTIWVLSILGCDNLSILILIYQISIHLTPDALHIAQGETDKILYYIFLWGLRGGKCCREARCAVLLMHDGGQTDRPWVHLLENFRIHLLSLLWYFYVYSILIAEHFPLP